MALPKLADGSLKPLVVDFNTDTATVGDMRLAKGDIVAVGDDKESISKAFFGIIGFLQRHTNWTEEEIDGVKLTELAEVMEMLREKEREASVPLANSGSSVLGQEEPQITSPTGS